MADTVIRHVIIRGLVQGVGYRMWTQGAAEAREVRGWVRNRRDGAVEALFAGTAEDVKEMIAECRNGPPGSRIDTIAERDGTPEELALRGGESFAVLRTV
jgi:acylphosphatase